MELAVIEPETSPSPAVRQGLELELEPAATGALAIFDLDRTLHAGSGLGVLARFAFRRRLIGPERLARSLVHDVVFRRRGSTDGHISSIAELALEMAGGTSLEDLAPVVAAAATNIATSVRPAMRLLLDNHLLAGHRCVVLSASPQPLVEQVAALLGVHEGIGTIIEDDGGVLTGRIVQPLCYGEGKLIRLEQVLGWTGGESSSTFSYAYADSLSDLPLLDAVSAPVVIAPDRNLRRLATERDWPVIDF
jgi:HAD superfamily hydrolase (TIGR01490 family)